MREKRTRRSLLNLVSEKPEASGDRVRSMVPVVLSSPMTRTVSRSDSPKDSR